MAPTLDYSKKPLKGQVAIVTGGSRGIGREICIAFAKAGAHVCIAAKSVVENPDLPGTIFSVADEVRREGVEALPVQVDVRKDDSILAMVDAVNDKWGRIDILINNAGALWWKNMLDTPMKRYDLINEVNARGTFACTKAVLPHMLRNKHGHIVNMSPPVDLNMVGGKIGYCISKFGMTLIAHGLGKELKGTGVACNALWPATMVESLATINFQLGNRSLWRKASIISDSTLLIVQEDPKTFTGQALIDDEYLATRGITDMKPYRCDPECEPPRLNDGFGHVERGLVTEVKAKL